MYSYGFKKITTDSYWNPNVKRNTFNKIFHFKEWDKFKLKKKNTKLKSIKMSDSNKEMLQKK